jgi:peptide/nickel transport system ATP-binding protein
MIFQDPMSSLNPRRPDRRRSSRARCRCNGFATGDLRARVADALDPCRQLNRAGVASRYPHQLSGGQRQRVGIARAIALEAANSSSRTRSSRGWTCRRRRRCINAAGTDLVKPRLGLTLAFISHDLSR